MKKYYEEIDILKGLAIFMVLLGHSIIVFPINLNEIQWCNFLHNLVSSVHLPLFFGISGFCYSYKNAKDFYLKKFYRIVIPYIVFCIIGFLPELLFSNLINSSGDLNLVRYIYEVFFIGSHVWFLYTLFILFLIFPIIEKLFKSKIRILCICIISIVMRLYNGWTSLFSLNTVTLYFVYFLLGYLLKKEAPNVFSRIDLISLKNKLVFDFILGVGWIVLFSINYYAIPSGSSIAKNMLSIIVALVGIIFFIFLSNVLKGLLIGDMYKKIGKVSLQLFLFNGYFLTISRTIIVKILGITNPVIIILGNLFSLVFISYLLIVIIVKRVKIFRIITGMA